MSKRVFETKVVALMLVLLLAAPQILEARYQPKLGWNVFPQEQEIQLGRQAAADTDRKLPELSPSDPVSRYVSRLGQELAAHAPGPKYPYSFKVVNQKEVNAFALPGGPIYINLGTIQAADNEAELAGVMAHEISHVVHRHATAAASKQMAAQLPLSILGSFLGRGIGGQLAQLGISFAAGSYFLKNSRTAESQADLLGTDIMYDTGFNPQAMADFFRKLEREGGARGPQFLSDHPNPGNRAERVAKEVATLPPKPYRQDSAEFRDIKRRVGGMKALTAQQISEQQKQSGGEIARGSVADIAPSSRFRSLDHSAFSIGYPENWQTYGDQQSAVTIAPQGGMAQEAIAYGVIINGFQPESGNAGLDEATHQLIESLHRSNPDLRMVGNDQNIRVNGVPGKSVDLIGPSPVRSDKGSAERERDWLVTLPRSDGSLLYVVFISPDRDFRQLQPAFESMLRSLRLK